MMSKKKEESKAKEKESSSSLDFDGMRQFRKDMNDTFSKQELALWGASRHKEWFDRHDDLLHGGSHHGVRAVQLRTLYNDVRAKLEDAGEPTGE